MFACTSCAWRAKTLQQMFRKLKLAGAHPDILWSIDAAKAQHNGEEMIRLETLMHERESRQFCKRSLSEKMASTQELGKPVRFMFWLRNSSSNSGSGDNALRAVHCVISPNANTAIVKGQLQNLFIDANVYEDFTLHEEELNSLHKSENYNSVSSSSLSHAEEEEEEELNLQSMVRFAHTRQGEHAVECGPLHTRGAIAIDKLRQHGVMVLIETDTAVCYLVTLPEGPTHGASLPMGYDNSGNYTLPNAHGRRILDNTNNSIGTHITRRHCSITGSMVGPNGEMEESVLNYLHEHNLQPFDLRLVGGESSMEQLITLFERLEQLYAIHRGRAVRGGVCIVISFSSTENYITSDGCIVLCSLHVARWEEFLLSLPQTSWTQCVAMQQEWRTNAAPLLRQRQRRLLRLADILNVYKVTVATSMKEQSWQDDYIEELLRQEVVMRKTIAKYNLKSTVLRNQCTIHIVETLNRIVRTTKKAHEKNEECTTSDEIDYRIEGDGQIYINKNTMLAGQILRLLKDNLTNIEHAIVEYGKLISSLEYLSRSLRINVSIDTKWKQREGSQIITKLNQFVKTITQDKEELRYLLREVNNINNNYYEEPHNNKIINKYGSVNQNTSNNMTWVVSDDYGILSSGMLMLPYNVHMQNIKRTLINENKLSN